MSTWLRSKWMSRCLTGNWSAAGAIAWEVIWQPQEYRYIKWCNILLWHVKALFDYPCANECTLRVPDHRGAVLPLGGHDPQHPRLPEPGAYPAAGDAGRRSRRLLQPQPRCAAPADQPPAGTRLLA